MVIVMIAVTVVMMVLAGAGYDGGDNDCGDNGDDW